MMSATLTISKTAQDDIEGFEISSEAYYTKFLRKLTWPGGASGPTVGVGYDLGYHTLAEVRADWGPMVDAATLQALLSITGLTGAQAKAAVAAHQSIEIDYDAAKHVFEKVDIPRTILQTSQAFPNCDKIDSDSFGALVSLVFNRGASCADTPSRAEMYEIRLAHTNSNFIPVPGLIRQMKRLWIGLPGMAGLVARRETEAQLYETGLHSMGDLPTPPTKVAIPAIKVPNRAPAVQKNQVATNADSVTDVTADMLMQQELAQLGTVDAD